jgi:hypothetical protein
MAACGPNGCPASRRRAGRQVQRPGRLDLRRHVGEQERQPLEVGDALAELLRSLA